MAIPFYWANYKWSDKATSLSKIFSFITMFGGAFGIIFLALGIMDTDIGVLLIGLLLLCSIILLNIYSSKILQKVAKLILKEKLLKILNLLLCVF